MEGKNFLFDEIIKFIDEYEDRQLSYDIMNAVADAAADDDNNVEVRKTMVAIAATTAVFLEMCANNTGGEKLTALDWSEPFIEILRFYCMKMDYPASEE